MGFKDKVKKVKHNVRDTVEEAGRDIGRELNKVAEKIAPADNTHHPNPEPRQEPPPQAVPLPESKQEDEHQQPQPEPQQQSQPESQTELEPPSEPQAEQGPHPEAQPAEPGNTAEPPPPSIPVLTGSIPNIRDNWDALPHLPVEAARPAVPDRTVDTLHSDSNKMMLTAVCVLLPLLLAFLCLKRSKKKSSRAPPARTVPASPTTNEKEGESAGTASDITAGAPAAARGGSPWTLVQPSADQFVANYSGGDNTSLNPHFVDEPEGAITLDPVAVD
eukprot:gene15190-17394_t